MGTSQFNVGEAGVPRVGLELLPCDGLASHLGSVGILLVVSCSENLQPVLGLDVGFTFSLSINAKRPKVNNTTVGVSIKLHLNCI